ncbi:hypothetical protein BDW74DRAFT_169786 [Aspergillus multicolor]|uniref:uncharacterized protein n=1 Tax=Aspergillus multicolor TaxID=41759 RepID=UPI003CCCB60D
MGAALRPSDAAYQQNLELLVSQTPPFLGEGLISHNETISFACEETPGKAGGSLHWPGVKGLEGYDNGNYLAVLYFAWAYILSARWIELLDCSADHEYNVSADEAFCWVAMTKYNGQLYLSPWSVSAKGASLCVSSNSYSYSSVAEYLARFCEHHRLCAQCSVALAARSPFLYQKQLSPAKLTTGSSRASRKAIDDLLQTHKEQLSRYMTLSSNPWGIRAVLHSTFFNPDIDCNLVSAWLNPAFAVLNLIFSPSTTPVPASIAAFSSKRHPRLGILWLGAICANLANRILRDSRHGMGAQGFAASAWTGVPQTFMTSPTRRNDGENIRRDDECRLLYITGSEGHERPPIWPWESFGTMRLCDTELAVRQHAHCAASHCLEYESWEWLLRGGGSIQDLAKVDRIQINDQASSTADPARVTPRARDYDYDLYSQSLSEAFMRDIFSWLRSAGYPQNERGIYQHS